MKNRYYVLLVISYSFVNCMITTISSLVSQLTGPYGYTSDDNSLIGVVFAITGLISAFIVGTVLDKTKKYKLIYHILTIGTCISGIFTYFTLPSGKLIILLINMSLVSIFCFPCAPLCFAYSVELTFPIAEVMSNGIMITFREILSTIFVSY
jgi:MFS family permease